MPRRQCKPDHSPTYLFNYNLYTQQQLMINLTVSVNEHRYALVTKVHSKCKFAFPVNRYWREAATHF